MSTRAVTKLLATTILGSVVGLATAPAFAADVTKSRMENADNEPQNWLMGYQNYSSQRFSRLTFINRANVANLHVAFTVPMSDGLKGRSVAGFEQHGLVDSGYLYIDAGDGMVYKIDVRSGTKGVVAWKADGAVDKSESATTRGIAMYGNAVFNALDDGRVIAINRDSGEMIWDQHVARVAHKGEAGVAAEKTKEGFDAAPVAIDGRLVVGNKAGDSGTRGWLEAINTSDGKEIWRTYTVPGPGEPGFETWKDDHNAWKTGGAAIWTTGSYDVAAKTYIQGAAQPVPMFDAEFRPGDNLYSNSVIGLDIDTGKIKWFFQYTPNESWDYDEQGVHMLADATVGGAARKMVVHFGRNGFVYEVDRTNGQFINASQYVDTVNWTAGIDPKTGKPIEYNPSLALQTYIPATRWARSDPTSKQACPLAAGAMRWQPNALNPITHVAFGGGEDGCTTQAIIAAITLPDGGIDEKGRRNTAIPNTNTDVHGLLTAYDLTTNKIINRLRQPYSNQSGALATAGGLVFTALIDGSVHAYNDETFAELWSFDTGIGIKAPIITYAVGNKQYLAVAAGAQQGAYPELGERGWGAMLYVFGL